MLNARNYFILFLFLCFCFSTTSQAVEVSKKMEAKHTILTHFSQRYAKVPLINENFNNQIGCAFDNMRVSIIII